MIDENPKLDDLLTDIVKNQAGVDSDIRLSDRGALLQARSFGATRLFVAPSTSAAARRWWDGGVWEGLAGLVRGTSGT
ncbi:MAG: hypothetical protein IID07_11960 [Gemmatimonadetes bacterium]|nr:hypothetical protein [Gemmatimonadota bacterium]MCH8812536.1 hypothetical protein [Gemmatimonadota bacterium]